MSYINIYLRFNYFEYFNVIVAYIPQIQIYTFDAILLEYGELELYRQYHYYKYQLHFPMM